MRAVVGAVLALMLSACATTPPVQRLIDTPSGRPEAVFSNSSPDQVQSKLASGCMDRGMLVVSSSQNQVQCEIQLNAMQSALLQVMIGNSYSTPPRQYVRFVITPTGAGARVQAQMWAETQMAFGQMRQAELNSNEQFNSVQSFLFDIGGTSTGNPPEVGAANENNSLDQKPSK